MRKQQKASAPARGIPRCVNSVYEQIIVKGASRYRLQWTPVDEATGLPAEDLVAKAAGIKTKSGEKIYLPSDVQWGEVGIPYKKTLRFLAGRDKDSEHAYALWREVRKLTRTEAEYELEAIAVLTAALHSSFGSRAYTRSELRKLDNRVITAATALRHALDRHDKFGREPSARNWSQDHAARMAPALLAFARFGREDKAPHLNHLYDLACAHSPSMVEILDVLIQRARHLASERFKRRKRRQRTGEAHDTQFIRSVLAVLIECNPEVAADHVARIVAPIVDKAFGMPIFPIRKQGVESKTFARCKRLARELKHSDLVESPALTNVATYSPSKQGR
jgi:hypothetical protein